MNKLITLKDHKEQLAKEHTANVREHLDSLIDISEDIEDLVCIVIKKDDRAVIRDTGASVQTLALIKTLLDRYVLDNTPSFTVFEDLE